MCIWRKRSPTTGKLIWSYMDVVFAWHTPNLLLGKFSKEFPLKSNLENCRSPWLSSVGSASHLRSILILGFDHDIWIGLGSRYVFHGFHSSCSTTSGSVHSVIRECERVFNILWRCSRQEEDELVGKAAHRTRHKETVGKSLQGCK